MPVLPSSLGLIGVGAFGAFCLPHLAGRFRVLAHDPGRDLSGLGCASGSLMEAAGQDIVLLAMPVDRLAAVARAIAPHLRPGALVVDVCSLKAKPLAILLASLPAHVDIVGTHPLFGPQSGRDGIAGLRIAVCAGRGRRTRQVARFLRDALGLHVTLTTPDAHDREMAHVQGLTHLIARIVVGMNLPPLTQTTTTFGHLMRMVDTVRDDSDALFRTITRDNPHVAEVKAAFFASAARLERSLSAEPDAQPQPYSHSGSHSASSGKANIAASSRNGAIRNGRMPR